MSAEHPRSEARWAVTMGALPPNPPLRAAAIEPDAPFSEPPPAADGQGLPPIRWKVNAVLFIATGVSVFLMGVAIRYGLPEGGWVSLLRALPGLLRALPAGWPFAVPLLAILLSHEFGHFIAARLHRVDASLPYFIPLPFLSPFGTMGAIISMPGRIRSRNALLDIGASGPLAGLCVAIPVLIAGLLRSPIVPNGAHGIQEGQCLLYMALKRIVVGPIPAGYDVLLSPTAEAGWAGLFVTMMNLVAVAQLDGGHIAYALFGARQNRYARVLHALLLVIFAGNAVRFLGPVIAHRAWNDLGQAFFNASFWLFWYLLIRVIMQVGGPDHPPTEPGELSPVRKGLAVLSLVLFGLLFMPTPWSSY